MKSMTQAKLNRSLDHSSQNLFGKPYKDLTEDERDIAEESISDHVCCVCGKPATESMINQQTNESQEFCLECQSKTLISE